MIWLNEVFDVMSHFCLKSIVEVDLWSLLKSPYLFIQKCNIFSFHNKFFLFCLQRISLKLIFCTYFALENINFVCLCINKLKFCLLLYYRRNFISIHKNIFSFKFLINLTSAYVFIFICYNVHIFFPWIKNNTCTRKDIKNFRLI